MRLYRNILFATDLSPNSDIVGIKAAALAKTTNAQFHIIHVMEPIAPESYPTNEVTYPLDTTDDELLWGITQNRLNEQAQRLQIPTTQRWILRGSRKEEIINLAEKINCDLLVVGRYDHPKLTLLFSSTAEDIFKAIPCDILAVRFDNYLEQ